MIAGLPTETNDDWLELRDVILEWKKRCAKGVLGLSFTAWQPEPSTPLATFPLNDSYYEYYKQFTDWFFNGVGFSNRIKIMDPACPKTRLESAMCRMGLSERELKTVHDWGPNKYVQKRFKRKHVRSWMKH